LTGAARSGCPRVRREEITGVALPLISEAVPGSGAEPWLPEARLGLRLRQARRFKEAVKGALSCRSEVGSGQFDVQAVGKELT
jgi:hypothetical protein